MIALEIDAGKIITVGLIPYIPTDEVIAMTAAHAASLNENPRNIDGVKMLIQIQVLDRKTFECISSVVLSPSELRKFMHLQRAVAKTVDQIGISLDSIFDDYRQIVIKESKSDTPVNQYQNDIDNGEEHGEVFNEGSE